MHIRVHSILFFILLLGYPSIQIYGETTRNYSNTKIPDIPENPVVDQANLIDQNTEASLNQALTKLWKSDGSQLAILTIESLEEESIENVSIHVVDKWKLGKDRSDNGILLLIASKDRQIRLEVGRGLEGALPDVVAKRIIDDTMIPLIRDQRISDALLIGIGQVLRNTDPDFDYTTAINQSIKARPTRAAGSKNVFFMLIEFFIFIAFGIGGLLLNHAKGRRSSYARSLRSPFGYGGSFSGSDWTKFGGGGWGSGGGFGGGGGGFGGGGASGKW